MGNSIKSKTEKEIHLMRQGGSILARALRKVVGHVVTGVSLKELDGYAQQYLEEAGGEAAFRGYQGSGGARSYPATLCASVNDEIVHGIGTRDIILKEGDIVGLDLGVRYPAKNGLYTDMAVTVGVGKISSEAATLMAVTQQALVRGIALVRPGQDIKVISKEIQLCAESYGYGVIRDLTGHGIGYALHEDPPIFNYDEKNAPSVILKEGMTVCIEPMISTGTWRVKVDPDGWTIRTADKSLAAHFEHTILVTAHGSEVITHF
ncbi:type I methionyl aminopeptidase [Candidatus Uhrbacteria bacterium]|nr:type I methionyl aminopeptidase [Candidatus Uhrbacteria bacterium]